MKNANELFGFYVILSWEMYNFTMPKEVAATYPVECNGNAQGSGLAVEASVTVYTDGSRDVGCVFLRRGMCTNIFNPVMENNGRFEADLNCVHLNPANSDEPDGKRIIGRFYPLLPRIRPNNTRRNALPLGSLFEGDVQIPLINPEFPIDL